MEITIRLSIHNLFTIPTTEPLPGLWLPGGSSSHDSDPASVDASVLCPGRSLFRPVGSPGGTGGPRFFLNLDNFILSSDLVSHVGYSFPSRSAYEAICGAGWLEAGRTRMGAAAASLVESEPSGVVGMDARSWPRIGHGDVLSRSFTEQSELLEAELSLADSIESCRLGVRTAGCCRESQVLGGSRPGQCPLDSRWSRILLMTGGSVMNEMTRIVSPQSQINGSTSKIRRSS